MSDLSKDKLEILRQSVLDAPVILKGEYHYFIHPLSDGVPSQSAELLEAARDLIHERVDWSSVDIILGIEAMGIPLAASLCLVTGKPMVIGRKRQYGLPGETAVDQSTGYSKGSIYLNDISQGDRVFIVDDVISTGGTLLPILKSIDGIGATVADCWIVFEKGDGMNFVRSNGDWPLNSLVRISMDGSRVTLLD